MNNYTIEIDVFGDDSSYVVRDERGKIIHHQSGIWGDPNGRVAESSARGHAGPGTTVVVYRETKRGRVKVR